MSLEGCRARVKWSVWALQDLYNKSKQNQEPVSFMSLAPGRTFYQTAYTCLCSGVTVKWMCFCLLDITLLLLGRMKFRCARSISYCLTSIYGPSEEWGCGPTVSFVPPCKAPVRMRKHLARNHCFLRFVTQSWACACVFVYTVTICTVTFSMTSTSDNEDFRSKCHGHCRSLPVLWRVKSVIRK
jgi:hypothetical protein